MRERLILLGALFAGASCAQLPSDAALATPAHTLHPVSHAAVERGVTTSASTHELIDPEGLGRLPARGVLVVGEVHGSNEVPAAFLSLVDGLVARSAPVVVALEMPVGAVDAGCATDTPGVVDEFWTRKVQDGRSSVAMRELVCALKQRASIHTVRLALFGSSARNASGVAKRLNAEVDLANAPMAVLVGNFHARNAPNSLVGMLRGRGLKVTSLTTSSSDATTWNCGPGGCSARPINMNFCRSDAIQPYRLTRAIRDARWDGCVVLPRLTASPPSNAKSASLLKG